MRHNGQVRVLVEEVGEDTARSPRPVDSAFPLELFARQAVELLRHLLYRHFGLVVLVELLHGSAIHVKDYGYLEGPTVVEACGLRIEGVEAGLVLLLERLLPIRRILSLPRLFRWVHRTESEPLLRACEDGGLRPALAQLTFHRELHIFELPLRLLKLRSTLGQGLLDDLLPLLLLSSCVQYGFIHLELQFLGPLCGGRGPFLCQVPLFEG